MRVVKGVNDFVTMCLANGKEDFLKEWDYEENSIRPDEITYHSEKVVHWKCKEGHKWARKICRRVVKDRIMPCPYCAGYLPIAGKNDLKTQYPDIAREWDYEENEKGPENYFPGSDYKAHWVCENGHKWIATVASRKRSGCPKCKRKKSKGRG